ncbi:uncharacterized protein BDZ99DRAFT_299133 [Mytilinidion resinicola]|uniref:Uncharacterized protein n=1 Tax=Mytilinidion resinicola TaxID=574789 RepID=A0A6A6YM63_9PEZI|nr:uncharacterized protein BDZ99DRAFT_299133 [Mytilinidion resinicola]KAF2809871.1 hypothetical protein BDZ99DRAFT_299133 [Mytilinidion resinicola]
MPPLVMLERTRRPHALHFFLPRPPLSDSRQRVPVQNSFLLGHAHLHARTYEHNCALLLPFFRRPRVFAMGLQRYGRKCQRRDLFTCFHDMEGLASVARRFEVPSRMLLCFVPILALEFAIVDALRMCDPEWVRCSLRLFIHVVSTILSGVVVKVLSLSFSRNKLCRGIWGDHGLEASCIPLFTFWGFYAVGAVAFHALLVIGEPTMPDGRVATWWCAWYGSEVADCRVESRL